MMPITPRDAKRKLPAERHNELLAAAVGVAASKGLAAVTLTSVAKAAGVAVGLVSHYFTNVENLVNATFQAGAQADLDGARERVAAETSATAQMRELLNYTFDEASLDAAALWVDASSLGRHNPTLAAEANALDDQWLHLLGDIVAAGSASGEFTVADPEVAARRILTIIDGLGAQAVVHSLPTAELKDIAREFAIHELGLSDAAVSRR